MEQIHDTFAIEIAEYSEWRERNRKNNFFELVYVLDGEGQHSANYIKHKYSKNGIFLLPAARCHMYIIEKKTQFLFLRFTGSYFIPGTNDTVDYSNWFNRLNFIMGNHDYLSGELIDDPDDKKQLKRLLDVILYEYEHKGICSAFVIQNTLVSVLAIISRNIQAKALGGRIFTDKKFVELLNFISFNILDTEKLSVSYLSRKFHISENYFSEYFKRNAAEKFQDFILNSKLRIAGSRAKFTDAPFQEIAMELGFTDSSHLNRMMKKYTGKGMRETRKEIQG
ncbi:AraC family transcriptional regulator [Pedobacter caeni]|uniref:AraC-type DNA-binding protein n=1 Tax=Pedobacter caeni TaxID=288992 RepID=A0A1M5DCE5_9SPHI|nr:helix-turn-helix transcriptional regulator [Pedobacter caeni]SHF64514.1 AraC-type DNA-binding protein [Pedobacter caeni]